MVNQHMQMQHSVLRICGPSQVTYAITRKSEARLDSTLFERVCVVSLLTTVGVYQVCVVILLTTVGV